MDSRVILGWLDGVRSGSPLQPKIYESVVWLPSPRTRTGRLQLRREVYRDVPLPPHMEQKRQQDYSSKVVELDPDLFSRLDRKVKMLQEQRERLKAVLGLNNEPLQHEDTSRAVNETDHFLETRQDSDDINAKNDRPVDYSSDEVNGEDPNTTLRRSPPLTIVTSRSGTIFSHRLPPATSSTSSPLPEANPLTCSSQSTTDSGYSRSESAIKHADDLKKLAKPMLWYQPSKQALQSRMRNHGSETLLKSINSVLRKGYLPVELRDLLDVELGLDDGDDALYAKRPAGPNTDESQLRQARLLASAVLGSSSRPAGRDGSEETNGSSSAFLLHLQSLLSELEALRAIVATTDDHVHCPRTEASWNENVHRPMLNLAIRHTPAVGVENVTRATIAGDFLPRTSARSLSPPPDGKLIDYVMVLKPLEHTRLDSTRIGLFIDDLRHRGFNQSPYCPLRTMPSGVFIGARASSQEPDEAKARLGTWLASWYGRVSQFPRPAEGSDISPPPVIPVLLVGGGSWELYFAFDTAARYEVCGPVKIGATDDLESAYRLLAVLRVLAGWMATDFLEWVEDCLQQAGV